MYAVGCHTWLYNFIYIVHIENKAFLSSSLLYFFLAAGAILWRESCQVGLFLIMIIYIYFFCPNMLNRGLCGLSNLGEVSFRMWSAIINGVFLAIGNTCYMNSALQCLSSSVPLRDYFLKEKYLTDLRKNVVSYNAYASHFHLHAASKHKHVWVCSALCSVDLILRWNN